MIIGRKRQAYARYFSCLAVTYLSGPILQYTEQRSCLAYGHWKVTAKLKINSNVIAWRILYAHKAFHCTAT